MSTAAPAPIRIVVALIDDGAGRALLVRKRGSDIFIQPGGKPEPGEAPLATLARELDEELGVALVPGSARDLGEFEHAAVNEPGRRVRAQAFAVRIAGVPRPQAEIEALRWIAAAPPYPVPVAPLSATFLLPLLQRSAAPARPATPRPAPASPPAAAAAAPRSSFVTVMATLSLALGALGGVSGLLQALALAALPGDALLGPFLAAGVPLPPVLRWTLDHLQALNLAGTLASVVMVGLSWGLLARREWGRRGFIALLVLAALANFVALALLPSFAGAGNGLDDAAFRQVQQAMQAVLWAGALAVAVLHGWIVWMLCRPAIRAEFAPARG